MRWLLPLLLCTCADLPQLAVVPLDTRDKPEFADVQEACSLWELDCYATQDRVGAITLLLTDRAAAPILDSTEAIGGLEPHDDAGCMQLTWACCNYRVIAHEMGHALGLRHVPDPQNIMHHASGHTVEAWQVEVVHRHAKRRRGCTGSNIVP
jgi:hypothetical protein